MRALGRPHDVLANFLRKEKALREGSDLPRIRPAIISLAGGTAGVVGLGVLHALSEHAPNAPTVCAGVSAGAANIFGFLGGKTKLGLQAYEHLASANFIEGSWFDPRLKIDYPVKILREGFKGVAIDQSVIYRHHSDFIVFTTEYSTAKGIKLDAKTARPDIVEAVRASMMVPGVCSGTVHIGDKEYVDGACGIPFPVREVVKAYRPTDILILFNRPMPEEMSWLEWHLFPYYAKLLLYRHGVPKPVRDSTAMMDRVMAHEVKLLKRDRRTGWGNLFRKLFHMETPLPHRKTLRWCIIAPEPHEEVSQRCLDRKIVRAGGERAYAFMKQLLVEVEKQYK